ncbi:MAG: S8 family serine peptidase [Actinomycetota bacterium]|nr:S8 family serine peptidase [Actinomycetota bacterium]
MRGRNRSTRAGLCLVLALMIAPLLPSPAPRAAPAGGFFVVHFNAAITDEMRASVASRVDEIIDYEPHDSYIVWADSAQVTATRSVPSVDSVAPLSRTRRLDQDLAGLSGSGAFVAATVYGPRLGSSLDFFSGLGNIAAIYPTRADGLLQTVTLAVDSAAVDDLVDHPAILYVNRASLSPHLEDEKTSQIVAGNILGTENGGEVQPGYAKWLRKVKLSGKGIRVAIVDTGISPFHQDVADRVVESYDYSRVGEPVDTDGHGTHVSGIVGGDPFGPGFTDPDGFLYGQGIAPKVSFIRQNAISTTTSIPDRPVGNFPPDGGFDVLSTDAWKAGARMWNASWTSGEGARAGYVATAKTMDEIARNAIFKGDEREDFLLVFSAGNSGAGGPTAPKEAKNLITVGATRSGRGLHWPLTSDISEVASFSSRGPTEDGRIFPTISAPGDNVISAHAPEGSISPVLGGCTAPLDAIAFYCVLSGTSMAAPHVTGASALVHEWWKGRVGGLPSPAMVKALLVNSATDIGDADIPNINEGWGRMNLGSLFAPAPRRFIDQSVTFGGPRQKRSYDFKVTNDKADLKVTLAWADAPAAVGANPVLVNDLDLVVEKLKGGRVAERYVGNLFGKGWSAKGGKADRLNNLENVFLRRPGKGTYRVTVRTVNLPGDGIPENRDKTDQDFALVMRAPTVMTKGDLLE